MVKGATHTAGPWTVEDTRIVSVHPGLNRDYGEHVIVDCRGSMSGADTAADKRLMALAPEMYSALLDAEAYCPVHVQDRIRALIGRAHG